MTYIRKGNNYKQCKYVCELISGRSCLIYWQNMFWLVLKQIRIHLKCQNMRVGARDNWRVGPSPLWEIKRSKKFSDDTNSQYHFRLALIWSAEHLKNKAPGAIFVSLSEIKPSLKQRKGSVHTLTFDHSWRAHLHLLTLKFSNFTPPQTPIVLMFVAFLSTFPYVKQ